MKMSFTGCGAVSRSGRLVIERLLVQVPVQTDHMTGVFGQDTNTRAAVQITIYNKVISEITTFTVCKKKYLHIFKEIH